VHWAEQKESSKVYEGQLTVDARIGIAVHWQSRVAVDFRARQQMRNATKLASLDVWREALPLVQFFVSLWRGASGHWYMLWGGTSNLTLKDRFR
jgi:hypothetical protein